ncbi:MAG: hypothetical protein FD166_3790, partial [Bacteroidetes bacterium]
EGVLDLEVADLHLNNVKAVIHLSSPEFLWPGMILLAEQGKAAIDNFNKIQIRYYDPLEGRYVSRAANETGLKASVRSHGLYGTTSIDLRKWL